MAKTLIVSNGTLYGNYYIAARAGDAITGSRPPDAKKPADAAGLIRL